MAARQPTTAQAIANKLRPTYSLIKWEVYRAKVREGVAEWTETRETLTYDNWAGGISIAAAINEIKNNESI